MSDFRTEAVFLVRIYFSELNNDLLRPVGYPPERVSEIQAVRNEGYKTEKTAVWNLLSYAVLDGFGKDLSVFTVTKSGSGKWVCPSFCFSLTHSHSAVAAAVSDTAVGIDLEDLTLYSRAVSSGRRNPALLKKKICAPQESELCPDDRSFMKLWTAKEAVFKTFDSPVFTPERICVSGYPVHSFLLKGSSDYVLSVCCNDPGAADLRCISLHPSSPEASVQII